MKIALDDLNIGTSFSWFLRRLFNVHFHGVQSSERIYVVGCLFGDTCRTYRQREEILTLRNTMIMVRVPVTRFSDPARSNMWPIRICLCCGPCQNMPIVCFGIPNTRFFQKSNCSDTRIRNFEKIVNIFLYPFVFRYKLLMVLSSCPGDKMYSKDKSITERNLDTSFWASHVWSSEIFIETLCQSLNILIAAEFSWR